MTKNDPPTLADMLADIRANRDNLGPYAEETFENLRKLFGDRTAAVITAAVLRQAIIATQTPILDDVARPPQ